MKEIEGKYELSRADVGRLGEEIASDYLIKLGYDIIVRNWRIGHLEIDIIAKMDNCIHIVEVRTLTYPAIHQPFETINRTKQRKVIRAASIYAAKNKISNEIIFDIISVTIKEDSHNLDYIRNAFTPIW